MGTPHVEDILWLAENNISAGWTEKNGTRTFRPSNYVQRGDMAAFLYRLAGSPYYVPSGADMARFTDITSKTPHAKEIWWLASTGISAGWTMNDGTRQFKGTNTVLRQDMAAFLHRLSDCGLSIDPSSIDYESSLEGLVYITRTGDCYHRIAGCRSINQDRVKKYVVSLEYAESHGYTPCRNCYH